MMSATSIVSSAPSAFAATAPAKVRNDEVHRIWALIERDMRKFFRSPALMMSSMIFPLVQLVVLGYAFGGKIKGVNLAVVDEDHSVESRRVREMFDGIPPARKHFAWSITIPCLAPSTIFAPASCAAWWTSLPIFRGATISATARASPSPKTTPTSLFPVLFSSASSRWWTDEYARMCSRASRARWS
jgi:hypothetical protein